MLSTALLEVYIWLTKIGVDSPPRGAQFPDLTDSCTKPDIESLRLDIRPLHHLGPLPDFLLDQSIQGLGCATGERYVDLGRRRLHVLKRQHLVDLAIELADHSRRRFGGNHHAGPGFDDHVGKPDSTIVGTSGNTCVRCGLITASMRTLPLCK